MALETFKIKAEISITVDTDPTPSDDNLFSYYQDDVREAGGVAELVSRYVKAAVEESDYLLELAAVETISRGDLGEDYKSLLECKTEVIK